MEPFTPLFRPRHPAAPVLRIVGLLTDPENLVTLRSRRVPSCSPVLYVVDTRSRRRGRRGQDESAGMLCWRRELRLSHHVSGSGSVFICVASRVALRMRNRPGRR